MQMNIVIIISLVYMLALVTAIVIWLAKCSREERLKRLKSFKYGKFAFIYLAVIPLFYLARRFGEQSVDSSFWLSVRACAEVTLLQFDFITVAPLCAESVLYHIAIEILFTLVLLNALIFTMSLCGQWVYNRVSLFVTLKLRKKVVAVIGTDKNTLNILDSVPKGHKAVLFETPDAELKDAVFLRKAAYCNADSDNKVGTLIKYCRKIPAKRKLSIILNLDDDEKSLIYIKQLCDFIIKENLTSLPDSGEPGLSVYVFATKTNEEVFAHYVEASNGIIRFINRHKQISMDFINRYPLTQFMTERELDYSTATVRDGIDLNIFMIGFGKLNESLFLASVSNNQFLTIKDGNLQHKPVNYHIYDRYYPQGKFTAEAKIHSENLNHGYLRYKAFLDYYNGREKEFLELLPMPANATMHALEITHPEFYSSIRAELTKDNSYNYIIVSFGTDMENIELAERLRQKTKEWNVKSPVKIFVKVRDSKTTTILNGDFDSIIFFGSDSDCVYNTEIILHEKINRMALMRHILYAAEDEVRKANRSSNSAMRDVYETARKKWYSYKEFQRESNIYACLSARMKLQLCGYDYSENGDDCSCEFFEKYEANDQRVSSGLKVNGATIWEHTNAEQFRNSIRWRLAVQEHYRWCAKMIASGLVPCNKKDIIALDKKTVLDKREHGNLTTMQGLVEFREAVADATGKSTEETDVIRYDYQLMDDIDWLLHACGYKLIRKSGYVSQNTAASKK